MLTVASDPNQPLPTGTEPLAVELGPIDADTIFDLAALSADGQLTVALNGGDDRWKNVATTDLGLGPLNGMKLSLIDNDPFSDIVLQGPDSITLALGNANGQFTVVQTATPGAPGTLAPAGGGRVGMDVSLLDQNLAADLATVAPGTNEVLVFLGISGDGLPVPDRYPSGASQPATCGGHREFCRGLGS